MDNGAKRLEFLIVISHAVSSVVFCTNEHKAASSGSLTPGTGDARLPRLQQGEVPRLSQCKARRSDGGANAFASSRSCSNVPEGNQDQRSVPVMSVCLRDVRFTPESGHS